MPHDPYASAFRRQDSQLSGTRGRALIQPLEPRRMLSSQPLSGLSIDAVSAIASITTTASSAPVFPFGDTAGDDGMGPLTDNSGSLINLDDFRADPRFSSIDGSGYASVILDTGIDLDHPFFGADSNFDGISDRIVYQYDFADGDDDASDCDGHGSNVSSIVGSSDGTYPGVAPGADVIALKVFKDTGAGNFSYVESALQWVVNNAATYDIVSVNMSLGDSENFSSPQQLYGISDELVALDALGVIVVSASGNDFYSHASQTGVSYPAADPNSLSVGAVFDASIGGVSYGSGAQAYSSGPDRITPFSQRHPTLTDIMAPGAAIRGASQDGGTVTMHGTSQASPHIAGIAVIVQQLAEQTLGRTLTTSEFLDLMHDTAMSIVDGDDEDDNVTNTGFTFPRVDVLAMAEALAGQGGDPYVTIDGVTMESGVSTYDFGLAFVGAPNTATFTVRAGGDAITLSDLNVSGDFSITGSFSDTSLDAGGSTQFTVQYDAWTEGAAAGTLSFVIDGTDPYEFSLAGSAVASLIVDDLDAGFDYSGWWSEEFGGYADAQLFTDTGWGDDAVWTFSNLPLGFYRVSTTWLDDPTLAIDAPFTISDDLDRLVTVPIDQSTPPADRTDDGVHWADLAVVPIESGTLRVRLTDDATGDGVIADAMRLEWVGELAETPRDDAAATWIAETQPHFFSSVTGEWTTDVGPMGYHQQRVTSGQGDSAAIWSFGGLLAGNYRISITWHSRVDAGTNIPFFVFDGSSFVGSATTDQSAAPTGDTAAGVAWFELGTFAVDSGQLSVGLANRPSGAAYAGAVRIEFVTS
jgi:hypothetical protein